MFSGRLSVSASVRACILNTISYNPMNEISPDLIIGLLEARDEPKVDESRPRSQQGEIFECVIAAGGASTSTIGLFLLNS